jgi:hypothetical protein
MQAGQPCAAIEVDSNNGSVVACFNPPLARRTYFQANYGLLYNNATDLFYTFIAAENANTTDNSSSTGTYDVRRSCDLHSPRTIWCSHTHTHTQPHTRRNRSSCLICSLRRRRQASWRTR